MPQCNWVQGAKKTQQEGVCMDQRIPENALVSCVKKVFFFFGLFHLFCFDLFKRRHYLMLLVKSNKILCLQ